MHCEEVQPILGRFHDGELPPAERIAIEVHLGNCPLCAGELAAIAELAAMTRALPVLEPPGDLWSRIADRLPPHSARPSSARPLRRGLALAAMVLVLIGTNWLAYDAGSRHGQASAPIAVQPAVDLGPLLDGRMAEALGEPINVQDAARQVDFRVLSPAQLPDGYCLQGCSLARCSCGSLVQCKYLRGSDAVLLVQCPLGQPVQYGNCPLLDANYNGKRVRIAQGNGRLAVSWQAHGAVMNLIGSKDLAELVQLMAFVDGHPVNKP